MLKQVVRKPAVKSTKSLFIRIALCVIGSVLFLSSASLGCFVIGDFDGDCQVSMDDLMWMVSKWMAPSSCGSETGLILHWKLDETSGAIAADSSGSGYNGDVFQAIWNPIGGKLGGALQFDGINDCVFKNGYQGITGSNPRTCTAWIKTDCPAGEIMSWGDYRYDAARWVVWVDGTGVLRVDVGGGYIFGTTVLTDDLWHHIAVTSDGSTTDNIALYVDGKIETIGGIVSKSINTLARATTKLGVLQLQYAWQGNYFEGLIDDARIYNRVLSMQEVWYLAATATTNNSCADLNMDAIVNLRDVARLAEDWLQDAPRIIISEFLADNESKSPLGPGDILDGNGESSDWIEIHNNSGMIVDIGGWYLTDESNLKTQWRFPTGKPQLVLQPGAYLVVFASGKTQEENPGNYPYVDTAGYLHTNFQLSKDGEYLGLIDSDGITPVHEYNHFDLGSKYGYPEQGEDISYGYYYDEERYFSVPTPGADNTKSPFEEVAEKPDVNFKGGCYVDAVDVTMNCGTPDAFIRYTTDGTVPSLINGLEYTGPIHITGLTTILAKAFKPGMQPSDTRIETYIFVDPAVSPTNTNLPIVVVDTLGVPIPSDQINKPYIDCRVVIVDTDKVTGRAEITGPEHFEGWGMIRRRGESTYNNNHYALEIQDEYRQDNAVSLLGMPAESDWILSWDAIDFTFMKNEVIFKWFRDMGHYAPRQRYVEVYLNTDGGVISTADYKGLFILREKIKRDENRVDIARLDASHNLEPKVSGGYILKHDKEDTGDVILNLDTSYYTQIDGNTTVVEPNPATSTQVDWIESYLNEYEAVLFENTASSYYVPGVSYADYIEEESWIDHGIVGEIGFDADVFRYSYYIYKDRGGKFCSGPPWDFDRGFHNNAGSYGPDVDPLDGIPDGLSHTGWDRADKHIFALHKQLWTYPEYALHFADRWFEHRENALNTAKTLAHVDQTIALITESRTQRKIKDYPNDYPENVKSLSFQEENQIFKDWITKRLDFLDGEIATRFAKRPPILSPVGGYVNPGSSLDITKPAGAAGDIYYTLNGEDPRLEGGDLNPNAQLYSSAITTVTETIVTMSSSVWKYLYDGSDQATAWRAYGFNDSAWGSGPGQLGFSDNGGEGDENTLIGPKVNGRRSAYFRHKFTVSSISEITALKVTLIHDDGAVVYINDQEVGRIYMPTGTIAYNTLANGQGENTNTVFNSISPSVLMEGDNILAVEVHQNTDTSSDISFDLSLEATRATPQIVFNKSTCVKARIKDGSSWSAMNTEIYGVGPVLENLRISELMYHPADPNTEFIEVQNIGAEAINLNLVHFTDGIDFTFGDYSLAAGGYALIVENITDFETKYGAGLPIAGQYIGALDNSGEEIVLRDAIGAEIHDFDYKDSWYELTDGFGFSLTMVNPASTDPNLWDTKAGWRSSLAQGGTPGGEDTVLAAGSIVINELLAHSHDPNSGPGLDWVELYNTTGQNIPIGGWFLSDRNSDDPNIMKYEIPSGTVINAHSYLVFVENATFGNPSAPGCHVPFGLSEAGETVYLYSGQSGQVTGYYQTEENFDASETDMTFGRYEKAELSGGYDFVRQSSPSQGFVNYGPLIADIVMTEIYYNPPLGGAYEFVELYNRSGSAVTLMSDASTETSPGHFITESIAWRLEGTGFEFPANTTIPAGGRIIVAKTPTLYGGPSSTVLGPYDGALDNGGEELEIQMPGDQEYGQSRYWIPIEKVDYSDGSHPIGSDPWPTSADGGGHSLYRLNVNTYGRDYSNWSAAAPTPGS